MRIKIYKDYKNKKRIMKLVITEEELYGVYSYLGIDTTIIDRIKNNTVKDTEYMISNKWVDDNGENLKFIIEYIRDSLRTSEATYYFDRFGGSDIKSRSFIYNLSVLRAIPEYKDDKFIIRLDISSCPLLDEDVLLIMRAYKELINTVFLSNTNKLYEIEVKIKEV